VGFNQASGAALLPRSYHGFGIPLCSPDTGLLATDQVQQQNRGKCDGCRNVEAVVPIRPRVNVFALSVELRAPRCYLPKHENVRCHLSRMRRRLSPDRISDKTGKERRISLPGLRPCARAFRRLSRGRDPSYDSARKALG
jgi:hypothetical protein